MADFLLRVIRALRYAKTHSKCFVCWQDDAYLRGWISHYDVGLFFWTLWKELNHPVFGVFSPYWDKDKKVIVFPDKQLWTDRDDAKYLGRIKE